MKIKILSAFLCVILLLSAICGTSTYASTDTVARAKALADGIFAYKLGDADSVQEWINTELAENAGTSSEWYVLALAQSGEYDLSVYETALLEYLSQNSVGSASSRLKYALCLSAIGSTDPYILSAFRDSVGKQGVLSYVYGLHLLNNGYSCDQTAEQIIATLLSLKNSDGGWSVTGKTSDVDVTAMTIQALAPHYENKSVKEAVDGALALLSERQLPDGDFSSYGTPNPESTSQVIIALCSLGIDPESDTRFIKNGNTLFDGIEKYLLSDGSLCHKEGGVTSGTATVQTLTACVAYMRFSEGKTPLYILDSADPENASTLLSESDTDQTVLETEVLTDENTSPIKVGGYKLYVSVAIILVGGIVCLVLFLTKKRSIKNFLAVILAAAICTVIVCVTDIKSADTYYGAEITKENAIGTVTMTIRCDSIVGKTDSKYVPEDGVILNTVEIQIEDGDTVYTVLIEAAQKYGIQLENNGNAEMAYISGMAYLYEQDYGDLSGWIYRVNEASPSVGCSEYTLSDGDTIEWHYTLDWGNDIK